MSEPSASAAIGVEIGDVLDGKFRIERVLGEGGMGLVVAATHLALGQLVALKFMLPAATRDAEKVARFEREARAAVRLKSEHVAKVSDVGRLASGAPYMVMEFLEGEDLDEVVQRGGPLATELAVELVLQACEAIAEAHALGIVHRDLKPKNLFLTRRPSGKPLVKVLDFGISKTSSVVEDMSLTSTTQVLGSPSYMSPEQLRSARDVDRRTDLWALGAILYELLTGSVPFVAESVTQLTAMVIADSPRPLEELRSDLPSGLAAVVVRCLEKRREARFQSVAELAVALEPFATEEGAALARELSSQGNGAPAPRSLPRSGATISLRPAKNAGEGTVSAWDRTQLAATGAPAPKTPRVALAAGLVAIVGVAAFALLRPTGEAPSGPAVAPGSSAAEVDSSALPSAVDPLLLPTVREPIVPLVSPTGGPERPPPEGFPIEAPAATAAPATPKSSRVVPKKPDAGAPPVTPPVTPPAATPRDELPNVRN